MNLELTGQCRVRRTFFTNRLVLQVEEKLRWSTHWRDAKVEDLGRIVVQVDGSFGLRVRADFFGRLILQFEQDYRFRDARPEHVVIRRSQV